MGNVYPATINAVNGTVPGPASSVTYDMTIIIRGGEVKLTGVVPGYRPARIKSGDLHVAGFEVGDRVMVAMIDGAGGQRAVILTPEPFATQPCGDSA